jgi:hypothetical protein
VVLKPELHQRSPIGPASRGAADSGQRHGARIEQHN